MDRRLAGEELRELLEYHGHRYYVLDAPEIGDFEYVMLIRSLCAGGGVPQLDDENSHTRRVAARAEHLQPVAQPCKWAPFLDMLTLRALPPSSARAEVVASPVYVVEPKIDVLSVSLEYVDGAFYRGSPGTLHLEIHRQSAHGALQSPAAEAPLPFWR